MGGLESCSGDWSSQLIGSEIPGEVTLALAFNEFLGSLTAPFRPLEPLSLVFGPVPAHLYVSERTLFPLGWIHYVYYRREKGGL